jgi:hypothetical protein
MLLYLLVKADINKALLVKEGLLYLGNHLFAGGFETESCSWGNEDGIWR